MPELPEVQTIVSDLNEKIKGDTIVDFWSDWPKAIKNKSLQNFQEGINGRKILGAWRIGKNIFLDLSGGQTLYIHLKMTGHLLVKNFKSHFSDDNDYFSDKVNQYVHHKWFLNSGIKKAKLEIQKYDKILEFSDVRKFGKIVLDATEKIKKLKEIKNLGVDALDVEFNLSAFKEIIAKHPHRPIGVLILDQNLIAGIGNIYRSEALFEAGILPQKLSGKLKPEEIKKLYIAIIKTLKKAIKLRGTSDSDYRDTSGAPGGFQKVLKVYRRHGQKCKKCGKIIMRKIIGQRSVFLCSDCQK